MINYIKGDLNKEILSAHYNHVILDSLYPENVKVVKDSYYGYRSILLDHTNNGFNQKNKYITEVYIQENNLQTYRMGLSNFAKDAEFWHKILIQEPLNKEKLESIKLILIRHKNVTIIKCH